MMPVRFDSERHLYYLGARRIPGVTEILRASDLLIDEEWMTAEGRERGRRVHKAVLFDVEGQLDEESIAPSELGYVLAARRAREEMKLADVVAERLLASDEYATHVDLVAAESRIGPLMIDWKSGGRAPWHALQTAGTAGLLPRGGGRYRRGSVYLHQDGRYTFEEHRNYSDFDVFRGLVNTWSWKARNGMIATE